MEIQVTIQGAACEIKPVGAISADTSEEVFQRFLEIVKDHDSLEVALNLEQVPYVDSAGLGMLVRITKRLRERNGGRLLLMRPQKNVRQLLQITKLDEILPVKE